MKLQLRRWARVGMIVRWAAALPLLVVLMAAGPAPAGARAVAPSGAGEHPASTQGSPGCVCYYFAKYDTIAGLDMIFIENPSASATAPVSITLGVVGLDKFTVAPGQQVIKSYAGQRDGPLVIRSTKGVPLIVWRRVVIGGSFEEIPSRPLTSAASEMLFPWYDSVGSPNTDWLLVINPNGVSIYAQVFYNGIQQADAIMGPGQLRVFSLPNLRGGPIHIYGHDLNGSVPKPILASQRVLWQGQINETWGVPAASLASTYLYMTYDSVGTNGQDWILVANTNKLTVTAQISIAGSSRFSAVVNPESVLAASFPNLKANFVSVSATFGTGRAAPILTAQRWLWQKTSLEELPGLPVKLLAKDVWFPYYDSQAINGNDWLLLFNQRPVTVTTSIVLGAQSPVTATLAPGQLFTFTAANTATGPVHVTARDGLSGAPVAILVSQRTLWNQGSDFNETVPLLQ